MKFKWVFQVITLLLVMTVGGMISTQPVFAFQQDYNRAKAFEKKGQHKKAIASYLKAAKKIRRKFGRKHFNNGLVAWDLADNYYWDKNYVEAEIYYKVALKIYEKKKGKKSKDVGYLVVNLADTYRWQKRYKEALPLYQRSLKILRKKLGQNHQDVAKTLHNLGAVYHNNKQYKEAVPFLQKSLKIKEDKFGKKHKKIMKVLDDLASTYFYLDQYREALPLLQKSLAIKEATYGIDHPSVADTLNNLASLYDDQGRYAEALPLYQRSLKIREAKLGPDHPSVADTLNNLAIVYYNQGRYADAIALYHRSLKIKEAKLGPDHPSVATTLNNLAIVYKYQGRYAEALPLYQRSLKIDEAKLGPDHTSVARTLNNLASLYDDQGRYADAIALYQRSLKIDEAKLGPDHPSVARTLNNLAGVNHKQGRYAEALPLYQRSLKIKEAKLGPDHPSVARTLNNLAGVNHKQGRYAEALPLYQRSLKIKEAKLGPDHPSVADTLNNLALAYEAQGRYAEAYQFVSKATNVLKKRKLKQEISKTIQQKEKQSKSAFYDKASLAHILARQNNTDPETHSRLINEGFDAGQDALSGDTGKVLAQMSARFASGSSKLAKLIRKRQDKIKRWQKLDKSLIAALSSTGTQRSTKKVNALRTKRTAMDKEIVKLTKKLDQNFPEFSSLSAPQALSITEVQKQLSAEEVLLFFLPSSNRTLVWAISKDGADWASVDISRKDLNQQISDLRGDLNADINLVIEKKVPWFDLQKSHDLYQKLFPENIKQTIEGKEKLLIVAGGSLSSLPFHVLVTEQPDEAAPSNFSDYKDVSWFAKKYSSTILPSVSSLKALRQFAKKAQAKKPLVGFANPDFGGKRDAANVRGQKVASLSTRSFKSYYRGGVVDAKLLGSSLVQLPDTEDELKTVGQTLGVHKSDIILRSRATETRIKKMKLDDYKIVYFATHGLVAGELEQLGAKDKAEPALVLSVPTKGTPLDDGLLTASEVAQLKLNADWVVLSACNTAAGNKPGAQALSGLARAFIYSGARSLLVSHWPVVSDAAVKLTTKLFDLRANDPDLDKAEALQQSMLALMNDASDPLNAYPTMWAPFIVVGD